MFGGPVTVVSPGSMGKTTVVMPMSPFEAPAFCWRRVGWLAFQPKRPSWVCPSSSFHTRFTRPEMPFLLSSFFCFSTKPRMVASDTASSKPRPVTCEPVRGETSVPAGNGRVVATNV